MNRFRSCVALAAAAALAGCAALAVAPPAPRAPAFDLIGRVAVTYDGRAFSSGVRWQHTGGARRDLAADPGRARRSRTSWPMRRGATLTGADRKQYRAGDVESLTRRALGWELPLTRLTWWVQGELVPGGRRRSVERDEQGAPRCARAGRLAHRLRSRSAGASATACRGGWISRATAQRDPARDRRLARTPSRDNR